MLKQCLSSLLPVAIIALGMQPAAAQTKKYNITTGLSAQVTRAEGSAAIEVAIPGVELIALDLTQPAGTGPFQIKTADYNFDGYKDFAFAGPRQPGGTQVYDIFLYHPADKTFEALELPGGVCEAFGNVRLNPADKTLRSSCRAGTKSSVDIFKYSDAFTPELIKSTDNTTEAQQEAAEEKTDQKMEKSDKRKEAREEQQGRRKERKEARDEEDD